MLYQKICDKKTASCTKNTKKTLFPSIPVFHLFFPFLLSLFDPSAIMLLSVRRFLSMKCWQSGKSIFIVWCTDYWDNKSCGLRSIHTYFLNPNTTVGGRGLNIAHMYIQSLFSQILIFDLLYLYLSSWHDKNHVLHFKIQIYINMIKWIYPPPFPFI